MIRMIYVVITTSSCFYCDSIVLGSCTSTTSVEIE